MLEDVVGSYLYRAYGRQVGKTPLNREERGNIRNMEEIG
jgi:hypothetical protein